MIYDCIGTIYKLSGVMLADADGNEYPEMVAVDGYHVSVLPQVALKFANRDQWLALGIEVIEEVV